MDVAEVMHQGAAPSNARGRGEDLIGVTYRYRQAQPPTAVPFGSNQTLREHATRECRGHYLAECGGSRAPGFPCSGSAVNQGNIPLPTLWRAEL